MNSYSLLLTLFEESLPAQVVCVLLSQPSYSEELSYLASYLTSYLFLYLFSYLFLLWQQKEEKRSFLRWRRLSSHHPLLLLLLSPLTLPLVLFFPSLSFPHPASTHQSEWPSRQKEFCGTSSVSDDIDITNSLFANELTAFFYEFLIPLLQENVFARFDFHFIPVWSKHDRLPSWSDQETSCWSEIKRSKEDSLQNL